VYARRYLACRKSALEHRLLKDGKKLVIHVHSSLGIIRCRIS
jgi:hypothetical protein